MTNAGYEFRLTEEIARWTFEVHVKLNTSCTLAFCNPTAGPWKLLTCSDESGKMGEVHRFEREEDRPDLVIVNDSIETVLIIEAKDSLPKLLMEEQLKKSAQVVCSLAATLRSKNQNLFWKHRCGYSMIPGLLWGATTPSTAAQRTIAFSRFASLVAKGRAGISETVVGIETIADDDANLSCRGFVSSPKVRSDLRSTELLAALGFSAA